MHATSLDLTGAEVRQLRAARHAQIVRPVTGRANDCPYADEGDVLWTRERFAEVQRQTLPGRGSQSVVLYRADGDELRPDERWRPASKQPRRLSRFSVRVLAVAVMPFRIEGRSRRCWVLTVAQA